ncbi:GNAT family N-acetyltransferase [Candidatus Pacearchaeota archaeon]|nr:GNAT family N-acetyltransferase [Candidatus Pacearchaeota archaeon]
MIIRKATRRDARKISLLRRKTLREINKNDYPKKMLDCLINRNSTKNILQIMRERAMFCAWQGRVLIGTVDLKGDKIGGLFIKGSEIGKGIGTQLMDFIEDYARKNKIKKVKLYSTNFAVKFYKKRGYKITSRPEWIIGNVKSKDTVMEKKL